MCIVKVRKIFENRLLQSIHTLSLSLNLYIHIVTGSGTIPTENGCNVQKSQDCALQQKCKSSDMLYKCTVVTADGAQEFYGLTSNTFKQRFNYHKASTKAHSTSLVHSYSRKVRAWQLSDCWEDPHLACRPQEDFKQT